MKGGNYSHNGSNLNKGNILKPSMDTLTEEGHKVFEAQHANLEELFLVLRGDTIRDYSQGHYADHLHKVEVMPKVRPIPSPCLNDVQNMINSALERQVKSTDELLHRLIEECDGKRLDAIRSNPSSSTCTVGFTQTNPHTSGPSAGSISMPNPSAQPMNHFHSRTTIEGSAPSLGMPQQATASMYGQGYIHTTPSFTMANPSLDPLHIRV
jgi:hypothetical protein